MIPAWDRTLPTLLSCVDTALRRLGGAPTYALTDNEKTVTVEHVARVAVRHPEIVAAGRHYGMQVATEANLLDAYPDMSALVAACDAFCVDVNGRRHRETGAVPAQRLVEERARLHVLPSAPYAAALGQTRLVNTDQTVRFGSVRYSTPPGLVGTEVWVRAAGDELVIVADLNCLALRPAWAPAPSAGLVEVARHALSTPGRPRIELPHYPDHPQDPSGALRLPSPRPTIPAGTAFLALGPPGCATPASCSTLRFTPSPDIFM